MVECGIDEPCQLGNTVHVTAGPWHRREDLSQSDGAAFARMCLEAAGLRDRVEVVHDERTRALLISGPDQFGLMGTTAYVTLRVSLPASSRAIALALARHTLGEFHASDDEITARAAELPLPLAMILSAETP